MEWTERLREKMEGYLPRIEAELRDALAVPHPRLQEFYGMMHYHLGWADAELRPVRAATGKRLRPLITMLVGEAVGGEVDALLPMAAAVELVHNFSLVHDDIEDQSETRRHRATVWALWGEPMAINVGDAMFTLAFLALSRGRERGVGAQTLASAYQLFAETCLALCEGQFLDMQFESRVDVTAEEYMWMIRGKTATLIACAAHLGALVGGADAETIAAYRRFGESLGMAFQVQDDILGIWGDPARTGKPAADDVRHRKKTLPLIYALEQREELREVLRPGEGLLDEDRVARVLEVLEEVGAREYAEEVATGFTQQAREALDAVGSEHEAHLALIDLLEALVGREV